MPKIPEYLNYEPSDAFTYAFMGYPEEEKGIFQLLRAFALALKQNAKLRLKIYGGLANPDVAKYVRELGLGNHVQLTTWEPSFERHLELLKENCATWT